MSTSPPLPPSYIPPTPHNSNDTPLQYPKGATFSSLPPPDTTVVNYDIRDHPERHVLLRAGLDTKQRLLLMTSIGGIWGFGIGAFLGARHSGLQYLAENAHKLPTTVQGWYFYHKTKNYRMMLGGVKRGVRFAGKTGGLCLLYGAIESAMDDVRGEPDMLNSVAAGIATGTIFSAITRLSRGSFRYSVFFGAVFGLATGGLSDLHRYASGNTPTYGHYLSSLIKKDTASSK